MKATELAEAVDSIRECIGAVDGAVVSKYGGYTKIAALRRLWDYLFDSPLMKFDDYWGVNEERDKVTHLKKPDYEGQLSSSEKVFLGVWRAHFNSDTEHLSELHMRRLDDRRRGQFLWFLSVADRVSFE